MASLSTISDLSPEPRRNPKRRTRSPSPSDQLRSEKRQRQQTDLRQPSPVPSTSSSGSSVGLYYGIGDDGGLDNIFASHPQSFTSIPEPHGLRGYDAAAVETYNNHKIWLALQYPPHKRWQKIKMPMLGPEYGLLPSHQQNHPQLDTQQLESRANPTRAEFTSALSIVQKVIGKERALTEKAIRACDRVRQYREWMVSSTLLPTPICSTNNQSSTLHFNTLSIRKVLFACTQYDYKPTNPGRPRTLYRIPVQPSQYFCKNQWVWDCKI
ncbi:hypothetical protein CMUS01_16779 [Colletotrichum musicola]|uniref:Uncharacterized protein n=1 Tax=Colletotrichum musicola TaxID=2175873 RepID=A0A8H6MHS0_9PEZI|nr:hypothetical protein CMUS01_16779 [Colletotrichum musicola]